MADSRMKGHELVGIRLWNQTGLTAQEEGRGRKRKGGEEGEKGEDGRTREGERGEDGRKSSNKVEGEKRELKDMEGKVEGGTTGKKL